MYDELSQYLSNYIDVTDKLLDSIKDSSIIKEYKKGSVFLREGDDYRDSFFVLKGCVRKYLLKHDEEVTIDIYTDEQAIIPVGNSSYQNVEFSLECIVDTLVLKSNEEQEEIIMNKFPELKYLCLQLSELLADKIQNDFSIFKSSNPEERYIQLIQNKPELLKIVPQYQLASYLGIKPESLSRIKKRLRINLSQ